MFRRTERLGSWLPLLRIGALACGLALCVAFILTGPSAANGSPPQPTGNAAPPPLCAPAATPRLMSGLDRPMFARARHPDTVLYDQFNGGTTGINSQQFEPAYAAYDAQAADDFTVPAGQTWTINEVEVAGGYFGGPGPVQSVNIFFYSNTGGPSDPHPGTPVFTQTGILYTPGAGPGDLVVPLNPSAQLAAGTYWVSAQARMDFATQGQWYWRDVGSYTPIGAEAAWRNPGNGYRRCADWAWRYHCDGNFTSHDQAFRLSGAANGTPLPTRTAIPTWTPAPTSPTPSGTVILPCPILTQPALLPTATPAPACGSFWREQPGPNRGTGDNDLSGVSAAGARDIWAVGSYYESGSARQTLVEHWDGTAWRLVDSPNVPAANNNLLAVSARAANDAWAVGYAVSGFSYRTLIEHWDGAAWSIVPSPNVGPYVNSLYAVKALAPDDVWAVGSFDSDVTYPSTQALTLHWDGTHWHVVPTPAGDLTYSYLFGVDASGPNDVWAAGYGGVNYSEETVIFHWDGTRWSRIPSPNTSSYVNTLQAVAVLAPNDAWVVGEYQDYSYFYHPLWEHWDGTQWTLLPYAPYGSSPNTYLTRLAAASPNDIWAAGSYTDNQNMGHTLIEHWDGQSWTSVASPDHAPLNTGLSGIALAGPGDLWAVGGYYAACERTVVLHYSDPCVTPSPPPSPTGPPPTSTPTPPSSPVPPSRTPTAGPSPTPCVVPFSDVQSYDYFYLPIQYLACHGALSGYADGTFRPYSTTTRSQTVKIVTRAFGIATYTPPAGGYSFADVPPTFPFFLYIETAAHGGIVNGYTCGGPGEPCDAANRPYFRPYAGVTRGQVAKLVAGAAGWALVDPPSGTFADVLPATAFYPFVETAYCHGALAGYSCGGAGEPCDSNNRPYFRQNNSATRGQIATIAYGALFGSPDCLRRR